MDSKGFLSISSLHYTFMPEIFAFAISTGVLFQFGFPLDDTIRNYPQLLMPALLTFSLGMILLPLRVAMAATKTLINPTIARWIDKLGTATLAASISTLILALPEAFTPFTNSAMLFPWSLSCELGLILLAIVVTYKLFIEIPTSCFEQYIKVVFFTLCVALAGLYTESMNSMDNTINFSSVIYQTFNIHQFVMVPCTFVLGVLLLILGVADSDSSGDPSVLLIFKEFFTTLTLSVGCITLLIGASLTVCASVLSKGMVGGFGIGGIGDGTKIGAV